MKRSVETDLALDRLIYALENAGFIAPFEKPDPRNLQRLADALVEAAVLDALSVENRGGSVACTHSVPTTEERGRSCHA